MPRRLIAHPSDRVYTPPAVARGRDADPFVARMLGGIGGGWQFKWLHLAPILSNPIPRTPAPPAC